MLSKQYLINEETVENSWRLFHIMAEFTEGFETLGDCREVVCMDGACEPLKSVRHMPFLRPDLNKSAGRKKLTVFRECSFIADSYM